MAGAPGWSASPERVGTVDGSCRPPAQAPREPEDTAGGLGLAPVAPSERPCGTSTRWCHPRQGTAPGPV